MGSWCSGVFVRGAVRPLSRALGLGGLFFAVFQAAACGSASGGDSSDGGSALEAGTDAGGSADVTEIPAEGGLDREAGDAAKGAGFCASRTPAPRFCDDFDDGNLKDGWEVQTILNGNPILDTSSSTSPPASFAVETSPLLAGENANVHLRTTRVGQPSGHITLSFSLMLATTSYAEGAIAIATLDVSQNHFFTLFLRDRDPDAPTATLEEVATTGTKRNVLTKLPPANVWTRVTIDVDLAASKASVLFGTDKVLDGASIVTAPARDPTIRIGAVYIYGPADPFEARFDDVLLDF